MAAIVRVKRRISDEPLENVLVSCKKSRLTDNEKVPETKLKFAGTVTEKTDAISNHIKKAIRKEKLEREYKRHAYRDPADKVRTTCQKSSEAKRYHVVSQYRLNCLDKVDSLKEECDTSEQNRTETAEAKSADDKIYCLYDIEQLGDPIVEASQHKDVVTCNSIPMKCEKVTVDKSQEYVYDIYYTNTTGFDYRWLESSPCIELYEESHIFMDDRLSDSDDDYEDDSDSNEENNWRNDYPDEDPHFYDPDTCQKKDEDSDGGDYENFGLDSDEDELEDVLARRIEKCFLDEEDEEEEDREYYHYLSQDAHSVKKEVNDGRRSYEQYKKDILKEINKF
ncbi:probable RNA polymerase II nuclear localization protein SLC7A6OS [Argonauta hians]